MRIGWPVAVVLLVAFGCSPQSSRVADGGRDGGSATDSGFVSCADPAGTCQSLGVTCGAFDAGCGTIDCGTCAFEKISLGTGSYPSAASGPNGVVVAFVQVGTSTGGTGYVFLAQPSDGGYAIETVAGPVTYSNIYTDQPPGVAVARDGTTWVTWAFDEQVTLGSAAPGAPGFTLQTNVAAGDSPQIALDAEGIPHLAYLTLPAYTPASNTFQGTIHHRFQDGGAWQDEVVDTHSASSLFDRGRMFSVPAIAFSPDGTLNVVYADSDGIHHAVRDGGAFSVSLVDPSTGTNATYGFNSEGAAFSAQGGFTTWLGTYGIELGTYSGGAWRTRSIPSPLPVWPDFPAESRVAVNASGEPVVVYRGIYGLEYVESAGGHWAGQSLLGGAFSDTPNGLALAWNPGSSGGPTVAVTDRSGTLFVLDYAGKYPANYQAQCAQAGQSLANEAINCADGGSCCFDNGGSSSCYNNDAAECGPYASSFICADATVDAGVVAACASAASGTLTCASGASKPGVAIPADCAALF